MRLSHICRLGSSVFITALFFSQWGAPGEASSTQNHPLPDDGVQVEVYELKPYLVRTETTILGDAMQDALAKHSNIAGGSNLALLNDIGLRRTLTLKDALESEPGVIIQDFFGSNDQPRIFIRGSGIQSNPQRRGVEFLQDGIPLNFADGSFAISLVDIRQARFIEVFRGSNALQYGSATLGGAINVVSRKGVEIGGLELSTEAGSFGYLAGSMGYGSRTANTDTYTFVSYNESDGFREHNTSSRFNAQTNLLWKINNNWQNGLYITWTEADFDVPGPLTWAQLKSDPIQIGKGLNPPHSIGPNVVRDLPRRSTRSFRVADKSIYRLGEDSRISASAYYQTVDDLFLFPVTAGAQDDAYHDYGLNAEISTHTENHTLLGGVRITRGTTDRSYSANVSGEIGKTYAENDLMAFNMVLYMEDAYQISERLTGILSFQLSRNTRNNEDVFETPMDRPSWNAVQQKYASFSAADSSLDVDYTGFNPKAGFVYYLNTKDQLYANVSRSFEPPTFDELLVTEGATPNSGPTQVRSVKLDAQKATTIEVGTRANHERISWNLSIYRSWVEDEILTTTDLVGVAGMTRNSSDPTIHQGLEFGLSATLFQNILSDDGDRIVMDAAYNYSDFHFQKGLYQDMRIAGAPEHYVFTSLSYRHPSGLSLGMNVEWVPEATPTDHQNTVYSPSYHVIGLRLAWQRDAWSVFVEGRNITNESYASSFLIRDVVSDPAPPTLGINEVSTYQPGQEASFVLGASLSL
ncbi:MAG: TonB-dependent receptor [Opitutales bacterium]|nr:TonB-dependent receptor [Opitutales bacterium]